MEGMRRDQVPARLTIQDGSVSGRRGEDKHGAPPVPLHAQEGEGVVVGYYQECTDTKIRGCEPI